MTDDEKATLLRSRGWSEEREPNYWVNAKTVRDPAQQDYTIYGLPLVFAYRFEIEDWPPFEPMGLQMLSYSAHPMLNFPKQTFIPKPGTK